MMPIYLGLAAVIVLIFVGFGISNWVQNRQRAQALAFEVSTPTPGPQPTPKPIQIKNLQPIGKPTGFPKPDLQHGRPADTAQGGIGQDVDGIPCAATEAVASARSHAFGDLL